VPRSSQSYRDERVLRSDRGRVALIPMVFNDRKLGTPEPVEGSGFSDLGVRWTRSPQAEVNWLKISGRLTYKGVPLTSSREASAQSAPEHVRPVRVLGSMIQTVSTPIAR